MNLALSLLITIMIAAGEIKCSVSNHYGRVGIVVSKQGRIWHVYNHSPASGLLYEGDVILEADGVKGTKLVDGIAGTDVTVKILRQGNVLTFKVKRVPKSEVFDRKIDIRVLTA